MLECIDALTPTFADATMVLASTDGNAATDGSNVLMLAMRWTASGVRWIFDGFLEMNKTQSFSVLWSFCASGCTEDFGLSFL